MANIFEQIKLTRKSTGYKQMQRDFTIKIHKQAAKFASRENFLSVCKYYKYNNEAIFSLL